MLKVCVQIQGVSKQLPTLVLLISRLLKHLKSSENAIFEMVSFEILNNLMHTFVFTLVLYSFFNTPACAQ